MFSSEFIVRLLILMYDYSFQAQYRRWLAFYQRQLAGIVAASAQVAPYLLPMPMAVRAHWAAIATANVGLVSHCHTSDPGVTHGSE